MKKITLIFIGILLSIALFMNISAASQFVSGDINGDGKVTAADARLALRYSARLIELTQEQFERADVNGDGKITASVARRTLRVSSGLDSFPERAETTADATAATPATASTTTAPTTTTQETTTTAPTTTQETTTQETTTQETTTNGDGSSGAGDGSGGGGGGGGGGDTDSLPTTKTAILARYKTVMNQAKTTDKPGFTVSEITEVPSDSGSRSTKLNGTTLMKTFKMSEEEIAEIKDSMDIFSELFDMFDTAKQENNIGKNSDMMNFPLLGNSKGCTLDKLNDPLIGTSDTATCDKLSNGNYKINIKLLNSSSLKESNVAKMFSMQVQNDFEDLKKLFAEMPSLEDDTFISSSVSNSITYSYCEVTLIFNPNTNKIYSLEQVVKMNFSIDIAVTAFDFLKYTIFTFSQDITTTCEYNDFGY